MRTVKYIPGFVLFLFSQFLFGQTQEKQIIKINSLDIGARFYATGFMPKDSNVIRCIELSTAYRVNPYSQPFCIKISINRFPGEGWIGLYWQNEHDNWGATKGTDLSKANYKYITFWAKGDTGYEMVEFGSGGINGKDMEYRDSYKVSIGEVVLTREWKKYRIDLEGKDLSNVIGGFFWSASRNGNPDGLTFYLDDILFVSDDWEK